MGYQFLVFLRVEQHSRTQVSFATTGSVHVFLWTNKRETHYNFSMD